MNTNSKTLLIILIISQYMCGICSPNLLINVRNQGGDILLETISSNITDDTITLEFQRSDGTLVTQLIDFRNEVQVIKALVLGEEERGQNQYQVMCFVNHFYKMDFISSDAMSKLRQKNPGTIRIAEEDRGHSNYTMDLFVDVSRADVISKHVGYLCAEAADTTYTRNEDLAQWIQRPGSSESMLLSSVKNFTLMLLNNETKPGLPTKCADTSNVWSPCTCSLELCIGWYPCGLKFCKGKADGKKLLTNSSYRCGIKTCKKSFIFSYYSRIKQNCLWDE